jgi:aconitate hydratase
MLQGGGVMAGTITEKILATHLVDGILAPGEEIGVNVDRALLQDTTGTMALLQFEALDLPRSMIDLAVQYVDHNLLQTSYENADDHRFLQTFAAKYGLYFSRPGNGVCHQVNLERFTLPGGVLLGADSHTPTAGGAGMLGIGVGGLDVAVAMSGAPYYLQMPLVVGVNLTGKLRPWVSAKDVILELLRRLTVKGGRHRVFEFYGEGVATLSVPERATITNMGAELGATSSVFPSDVRTKAFFQLQQRLGDWMPLETDADVEYDENYEVDLTSLEPLVACPGSPDNVKKVCDIEGLALHQVLIGSCTNSSYRDLMVVAEALKHRSVHTNVDLHINPGSRQALQNIMRSGGLERLIRAGARIFETGCDGCVGLGSAPPTNANSLRSFNRNWTGRSGTQDDNVYLASPEVCVAAAIYGELRDPRHLGEFPAIDWPRGFIIDDSMIIPPSVEPETVTVVRGPNIQPLPRRERLESNLEGPVLIKVGDDISTDAILPAGGGIMSLRSNIPAISEYVFKDIDPEFVSRAKAEPGGFIAAGSNYGQGSSREHAALSPMYLGIKAVIAKSFARIHKANLINFGILPLQFSDPSDFDQVNPGDRMSINGILDRLQTSHCSVTVDLGKRSILVDLRVSKRHRDVLIAGGLLNYTKAVL